MFLDLVSVGSFLLIAVLVFVLGDLMFGGRRRQVALKSAAPLIGPSTQSYRYDGPIAKLFANIVPQLPSEVEAIRRDLTRAGFYSPTALREYMATRNAMLVMIAVFTVALAWQSAADPSLQRTVIVTGWVVGILGYALPRILLRSQANSRVYKVQRGLPDALDVITMCLTGGLPLQEALGRVTSEMQLAHPEIAVELEIVRKQADANSLSHAMKQFANRVDLPDVKSMAALVSQTERLGTNVATAVREFADSLRRSSRHRAEERANKASVKLLFPVVLCLAPPVYILLCGPSVLQLRDFVLRENAPGGMLSTGMGRGMRQLDANGQPVAQSTAYDTNRLRSAIPTPAAGAGGDAAGGNAGGGGAGAAQ